MAEMIHINELKYGMRLSQNIYRHDSLLALPKGSMIRNLELSTIRFYNYEYVLVEKNPKKKEPDFDETLEIIETAYTNNSLWDEVYGGKLFKKMKKALKNKRVKNYLNDLRKIDSYSFAHCINISIVVVAILNPEQKIDKDVTRIAYLTLLHDIGRIKVGKLFNKEGKLDDKEFKELQNHPIYSYKMLKRARFSDLELKFSVQTHERFDGAGYPYKLKGDEITDLAQIVFIADVYNGLSSYRPHRQAYSPYEVLDIVEQESNKMFGEKFVEIFLNRFTPYRVGAMVELDNGSTAIVKKMSKGKKSLPVVDIISETTGKKQITVDLSRRSDLRIRKIIKSY